MRPSRAVSSVLQPTAQCAQTDGVGKLVKSLNVISWEDACVLNPKLAQGAPAEAAE